MTHCLGMVHPDSEPGRVQPRRCNLEAIAIKVHYLCAFEGH
jgi:hypothetical protein